MMKDLQNADKYSRMENMTKGKTMFKLWVEGFDFGTFATREEAARAGKGQRVYFTIEEVEPVMHVSDIPVDPTDPAVVETPTDAHAIFMNEETKSAFISMHGDVVVVPLCENSNRVFAVPAFEEARKRFVAAKLRHITSL
jgi:hypothetical protein